MRTFVYEYRLLIRKDISDQEHQPDVQARLKRSLNRLNLYLDSDEVGVSLISVVERGHDPLIEPKTADSSPPMSY